MNSQLLLGTHTELDRLFEVFDTDASTGTTTPLAEQDFIKLIEYAIRELTVGKALEITNAAIRQHKFSPELHTIKAQFLIDINAAELALESLDRAEIFGKCFITTDLMRVEAFILLQDYHRAYGIIHDLRINYHIPDEQMIQTYLLEAQLYKTQNQYEDMYNTLEELLLMDASNQQALKEIWLAMQMTGRYEDCIHLHHYLLEQDAYLHLAWFNLGHAYYSTFQWEKAMEAYDFAITCNEHFQPAYYYFVETAMHRQKYFQAIHCIDNARTFFDLDEELLFHMAICLQKVHLYDKAKNYFFRTLKLDPYNTDIYCRVGECYAAENRHQEALYYFRKAIEMDAEHEDYQLGLAKSLLALGLTDKAETHFHFATSIAPHRNDIWSDIAVFHLQNNRLSQALQVLEEAAEFTHGADLSYCKAACHLLLGNLSACIRELAEGLIENFGLRYLFFSLVPKTLHENRKLKAVVRYYEGEA